MDQAVEDVRQFPHVQRHISSHNALVIEVRYDYRARDRETREPHSNNDVHSCNKKQNCIALYM